MKERLDVLKSALGVVVFLFAALGGYLLDVSPPDTQDTFNANFPTGLAQFVALLLFLLAGVWFRNQLQTSPDPRRLLRRWTLFSGVLVGLALVSGMAYYYYFGEYVVYHPAWELRLVRGELIDTALEICREDHKVGHACELYLLQEYFTFDQVVNHFLWTKSSVTTAKFILLGSYLAFIISLSGALFCLIELGLTALPAAPPKA